MSNHINVQEKKEYSVVERKEETPGIVTLRLIPVDSSRPTFISGQFLTVYFPELGFSEGKAYSISSAPGEEGLSITVKDIGAYSHKLCTMREGEPITASGPYGFFYSEEPESTLVLLAAGIGVAPFRSMIQESLQKNPSRKVSLYYSISKSADAVFLETFSQLQKENPHFTCTVHITKEEAVIPHSFGRIPIDQIASLYRHDPSTEYLMCGSIPFVRDMWKGLRAEGVPEDRLYTEAFFS